MITKEALKALTDTELAQVGDWVHAETATRKEQRKQDAIAKIRELAAGIGVSVAIGGVRGRPAKAKPAKSAR